ncbi:hypothetical protein [Rhizobium sp. T1470]|uniref:hypothetical protein n=1 Tax=unclassified Rhizobium TaxID=2613769 RepID=UPI0035D026ED
MIRATDSLHAPWWIVNSNDKKSARINCITHLLKSIPYERVKFDEPKLGKRQKRPDDHLGHHRPKHRAKCVLNGRGVGAWIVQRSELVSRTSTCSRFAKSNRNPACRGAANPCSRSEVFHRNSSSTLYFYL